jgi:hypothetical protein
MPAPLYHVGRMSTDRGLQHPLSVLDTIPLATKRWQKIAWSSDPRRLRLEAISRGALNKRRDTSNFIILLASKWKLVDAGSIFGWLEIVSGYTTVHITQPCKIIAQYVISTLSRHGIKTFFELRNFYVRVFLKFRVILQSELTKGLACSDCTSYIKRRSNQGSSLNKSKPIVSRNQRRTE